ncbi:MAG: molybdenum cofactor biosynthesis protein MoaE [Acidobacteriales bacterium]|nr:molybdenum cofactor biosynthesis protein MoaE [Terriglobales bacterium]
MQVRVIYQGVLKETLGRKEETVELREGASLRDLLDKCQESAPVIADYRPIMALSVNYEYALLDHALRDGDEVAMLPPVAGGATAAETSRRCAIVRGPIDQGGILNEIKRPEDGAVSVFDGIVRDNTRGRHTQYLVYEAYEEMALRQMDKLCQEAIDRFKVRDARIVHRIGRLEIGETSVFIVVASAHRAAAMEACRFLIDSLKRTVPIWKKEYFEDGAVWADGEPFPDDIRGGGESASKQ